MSKLGYIKPWTIAYIFYKVMDYPCANCYIISSLNVNSTNIFQFLAIFAKNGLFCLKMSNLIYVNPCIIAYILFKVMDYPCANLYTIWSLNINSTNIFQFLAIFAQKWTILP